MLRVFDRGLIERVGFTQSTCFDECFLFQSQYHTLSMKLFYFWNIIAQIRGVSNILHITGCNLNDVFIFYHHRNNACLSPVLM